MKKSKRPRWRYVGVRTEFDEYEIWKELKSFFGEYLVSKMKLKTIRIDGGTIAIRVEKGFEDLIRAYLPIASKRAKAFATSGTVMGIKRKRLDA